MKKGLVFTIGAILLIAGFVTSGLWPWQLPAVFFGGLIVAYSFSIKKK